MRFKTATDEYFVQSTQLILLSLSFIADKVVKILSENHLSFPVEFEFTFRREACKKAKPFFALRLYETHNLLQPIGEHRC